MIPVAPWVSVDWQAVDTVLLDMDGTLLDLRFDNRLWHEHLPARYAARRRLPEDQARRELERRFKAREGSLEWYCMEHWSRELGLDVAALEAERAQDISAHAHVPEFLAKLGARGKRRLLVTNAHPSSLRLKLARTGLADHLDGVVSSHHFSLPKEDVRFWGLLQRRHPFTPDRTLLLDDNPRVLASARDYGIAHLLGIALPDSGAPRRRGGEFPVIDDFLQVMPD